MNLVTHAAVSWLPRGRLSDVVWGLAPDLANPLLLTAHQRLPERDTRVLASRVLHSPIVVVGLLVATRGRSWPYLLHWLMDAATHERRQWLWPLIHHLS